MRLVLMPRNAVCPHEARAVVHIHNGVPVCVEVVKVNRKLATHVSVIKS